MTMKDRLCLASTPLLTQSQDTSNKTTEPTATATTATQAAVYTPMPYENAICMHEAINITNPSQGPTQHGQPPSGFAGRLPGTL